MVILLEKCEKIKTATCNFDIQFIPQIVIFGKSQPVVRLSLPCPFDVEHHKAIEIPTVDLLLHIGKTLFASAVHPRILVGT